MRLRVIAALLVALFANCAFAVDVIVTKSAKKIDAKILEVSSDTVKYKKSSNLGGPTYILKVSEIQTIVYDNGKVETFKRKVQEKAEKQQRMVNKPSEPKPKIVKHHLTPEQKRHDELELRRMIYNRSNIGGVPNLNSSDSLRLFANSFNYNQDGFLEYEKLDGVKLSDRQYAEYLRTRCRPAYDKYISGNNLAGVGGCLTIMGGCFLVSGMICLASYDSSVEYDSDEYDKELVKYAYGTAGTIVGAVCTVVGIPLWISGSVRKHRSIDIYNDECGGNDVVFEYRVGSNGKNLGLTFNF